MRDLNVIGIKRYDIGSTLYYIGDSTALKHHLGVNEYIDVYTSIVPPALDSRRNHMSPRDWVNVHKVATRAIAEIRMLADTPWRSYDTHTKDGEPCTIYKPVLACKPPFGYISKKHNGMTVYRSTLTREKTNCWLSTYFSARVSPDRIGPDIDFTANTILLKMLMTLTREGRYAQTL